MGTTSAAISSSHLSTKSHQNYYYNEYHEGRDSKFVIEDPDKSDDV
ncbi:MAG TPA: hypothetical protein VFJ51_02570 [Nitrososphaeraceae archaeon]|nr:hypothetical protein [Nitrososphaeraceae archaeon]